VWECGQRHMRKILGEEVSDWVTGRLGDWVTG
jgi:hypothetical protein